jgi:dTDP-4-amino-4,6-dideoxygalactose transaminase
VAWEITLALRRRRAITGMAHGRWVRHGYDRYVLRLRGLLWRRGIEETVAALRAEGIPCEPAFGRPLYLDERVREALGSEEVRLAPEAFAIAERLPQEWIAVPLSAAMRQREVDDLVAAVEKVERAST